MFLSVSVPVRKPVVPAIRPPVMNPNSVRSPHTPLVQIQSPYPKPQTRKSSGTTATAMFTRSKTKGGTSQPLGGVGTGLSEDSTALASNSVPLTGDLQVVRAPKPSTPDRPIWVPVLNPHPVLSPRISPARSVVSARATEAPITIPKSTADVPAAVPRKRGRPRKSQTQLTSKPVSKKVATKSKTKAQVLRVKLATSNNSDPTKPAKPLQSAGSHDGGKSSGVNSRVGQSILPYVWVRDCKIGKGRTAQPGDQVSIRFKGRIQDEKGIVYDENVRGEPVRIFFSISSKPA